MEKRYDLLTGWQTTLLYSLSNSSQIENFNGLILQILSVIEEMSLDCSAASLAIFKIIVQTNFWSITNPSTFYGACRFIAVLISRKTYLCDSTTANPLMDIAALLLGSKSTEALGYRFLENLLPFFVSNQLYEHLTRLMSVLFQRLSTSKSLKRSSDTARILSLVFLQSQKSNSITNLLDLLESIQSRLILMIIGSIYESNSEIFADRDKKLHFIFLCTIFPLLTASYAESKTRIPKILSILLLCGVKSEKDELFCELACARYDCFFVSVDNFLEPIQYLISCLYDWNSSGICDVYAFLSNMDEGPRNRILSMAKF